MEPNQMLKSRIESLIESDRIVLFMKGTRMQPMCGFSAATIGILDSMTPEYTTFNVLEDQGIREGIKAFSEWPTIPQLYIDKEFVGGCDIVKQMFNNGELHEMLGVDAPDRTPPEIAVSAAAAAIIANALDANPGNAVHLSIDGHWQHAFNLGPMEGHEIRAESNGVTLAVRRGVGGRRRKGCRSTSKRPSREPHSRLTIPMRRLRWAGCRRPSSRLRGAKRALPRRSWTYGLPTSGRGRLSRARFCSTTKA